VVNEALCLKLARTAGLPAAHAETRNIDGIDYILVQRYDRCLTGTSGGSEHYERLHQEDFCQALGIVSEHKYQGEGGPSLKQCFDLLRNVSAAPVIDLQRLLDAVIFNYLIGNYDAHGKNFSIVYNKTEAGYEARFSPLYDIVCTVYYPDLSKKMAMKIGGEYLADRVRPHHFEVLADEAGLAKPLVKRRVPELASAVIKGLKTTETDEPVATEVAKVIGQRSREAISRFAS
jgi:serine/threonine-protein kinase HipA